MSDIVLIAGSPTPQSRTAALLEYMRNALCQRDLNVTHVNILDFDPADLLYARIDSPAIQRASGVIAKAQVVIVGTPVYKASYTGALKTFLDLLPQNALRGKTVLPLVSGGSPGHQLVLDYALKPVLSALGAQHILQGIYILDKQVLAYGNGVTLALIPEIEDRLLRSIVEVADIFAQQEPIPA